MKSLKLRALLLGLVLLLPIHLAWATIALVQKTNGSNSTATSITATLNGVAANNFLAIVVTGNSGALTPSSVTDSNGTVSVAVAFATTSVHAGLGIYYVPATSAGTHIITLNWASTNGSAVFVAEYSGVATSAPFDVGSAVAFGTAAAVATANITPAGNGELIVFGIGQQNSGDLFSAFTNGFVEEDSISTAPSGTWADLVQTTAAAISGGATTSVAGGAGWAAAVAAFKPASASVRPSQFFLSGATHRPQLFQPWAANNDHWRHRTGYLPVRAEA